MGLRAKIFLTFGVIIVLLMGFIQFFTSGTTEEHEISRIDNDLLMTHKRFESRLESESGHNLKLVETIISDQKYRSFLAQIKDNFYSFTEEIAADSDGDIVLMVDEDMTLRGVSAPRDATVQPTQYQELIEERLQAPHVSDIIETILDNGERISRVMVFGDDLINSVHVPLKESMSDDYALGVISVGVKISDAWIARILGDDYAGINVVFHVDGRPVAANISGQQSARILEVAASHNDGTAASFVLDDERFIMLRGSFAAAGRPAGYVLSASLDRAMEPFVQMQLRILLIGAAALMLGLTAMLLLTNRIVSPIRLLVRGTEEVEAGNYDYQVDNRSQDEVGQLSLAFNKMTQGLREREKIRNLFGKYVHPSIVSDIIENPEKLGGGGQNRIQTLMFSDVAGFTAIGQAMDPEELVTLLNDYLGAMTDELAACEGILDKYLGDGIMAFWGEPFAKENHALQACRAALNMQRRLAELRETWRGRGLAPLFARIGIATGEVIVGNIGSEQSRDYTCIGDTVNLGSRLEGVNKAYGTSIIIDQATRDMAGEEIAVRELDTVEVMGREGGTRIFELRGLAGGAERQRDLAGRYEILLECYRKGEFDKAAAGFTALAGDCDDQPSLVLAERCRQFLKNPPADWAGIHAMVSK